MTNLPNIATRGPVKLLIIDENLESREELKLALRQALMTCEWVHARTVSEAVQACIGQAFDCAIVTLPILDGGMKAVTTLVEVHPELPVVVVAADGDEKTAVQAMLSGAADYIRQADLSAETIGASVALGMKKAALFSRTADRLAELESFAAVLAHDLSAPVASMQLFARAIETDLNGGTLDKTELLGLCREVVRAGKRTGHLIDILHDYTKIEPESAVYPVDMGEAFKGALFNLTGQIAASKAKVTLDPLPWVMGDEAQLVNLLQNLIGNAIKYCETSPPEIHVSASRDQANDWVFAVKDNGIGVLPGAEERIFAPFSRLHGVGRYEGSGLGLSICRKLVSRHGGLIRCQSNGAGKGSTFFFSLPDTCDQMAPAAVLAGAAEKAVFHLPGVTV